MPINMPESCRNITSGALREVKSKGASTASRGIFSQEYLNSLYDPKMYFSKIEPAGVFMETLDKTAKVIEQNAEALSTAANKLVDTAKQANKQMSDVTGKFRDGTEKLSIAIDKLMKVAGRGDFAETVRLTESLVDSLERLAELEEKGILDRVMTSMRT